MNQDKEQACHNSSNPSVAVSAVIPGRKIKNIVPMVGSRRNRKGNPKRGETSMPAKVGCVGASNVSAWVLLLSMKIA